MREMDKYELDRRRVLKLLGSGAVLLPLAGLSACSGEKPAAPAAETPPAPEPEPAATSEPQVAVAEPAGQGELPMLTEDDPQAIALSYVEDATAVDGANFPQYKPGQACANCALYQGGDAPTGACSIYPGKAVKATGWCSVYAPKG